MQNSLCDFAGTLVPVPKSTECYWDVNLILFNAKYDANDDGDDDQVMIIVIIVKYCF